MDILKAYIEWALIMGGITGIGLLCAGILTLVIQWFASKYRS